MRSLELLVRTYPNKTCSEILEIREQEKLAYEIKIGKYNEKKLAIIKDINENGGYFKGTFGLEQYFYYNFSNLKMCDDGKFVCDVDHICYFKQKNNQIYVKRNFEQFMEFENYGTQIYERVTKEDFEKVTNYMNDMVGKFWTLIDENDFK